MPDPSLPLPNQLEIALRKIKENVRIILETRATCKSLEEVIRNIFILISVLRMWNFLNNIFNEDGACSDERVADSTRLFYSSSPIVCLTANKEQ